MINQIEFPAFGLSFQINRIIFSIGNKPIYWYGVLIALGFLLGLIFVSRESEKNGVSKDTIYDISIYGLIFGLIGARLYYIIFDFDSVRGSFFNIFAIWNGGIAIYGGIIGAVVSAYWYCRRKKLDVAKVFDVFAPGLFIGQIIGRWGNFVNAEVYGKTTDSIFRMVINQNEGVHPLFLYESVWNTIGLLLILWYRKRKKVDGEVFLFYILWYALGRIWLEGMRQPEYILYLIPNVLGISQLVSLLCIVGSIFMIIRIRKKSK